MQCKKAEKNPVKRRSMYKSFLPLGLPTSISRIGLRNEVRYHIVNTANVRSLVLRLHSCDTRITKSISELMWN